MKRNLKKVELPPNFAQKILQSEIEYKLNPSPSKDCVRTLIQLYSQGVQYYESVRSHKYLYFQMKMTEIFNTASTISSINEQNKDSDMDSPLKKKMKEGEEEEKIKALKIKQKQQKLAQQILQNTKQTANINTVKKMINDNDRKGVQNSEKIKKEIMNQQQRLKQKMQKRKSRILFSKSFSGLMDQNDTQDTLFTQNKNQQSIIKPIQVNFSNAINQNESDDEQIQKVRTRKLSVSQDPSKKIKHQMQQNLKTLIPSKSPK